METHGSDEKDLSMEEKEATEKTLNGHAGWRKEKNKVLMTNLRIQ